MYNVARSNIQTVGEKLVEMKLCCFVCFTILDKNHLEKKQMDDTNISYNYTQNLNPMPELV